MAKASKRIGVLTAGGDSPGLNAAIRGLGKAAIGRHNMELIGFRDGVRGLAENRFVDLGPSVLSGILTVGGTILGTSRDKVHKMMVDREPVDMIPTIVEVVEKNKLDCLVMIGGGGTAKNAWRQRGSSWRRAEMLIRPEKMCASVPCRLKKAVSRPSRRSPPGLLK